MAAGVPKTGRVDDWEALIAGVRAGEADALDAFFRRFGPALERLAARAIEPGMRRRFGPESIAQSVCRTFLQRARDRAYDLPDGDALWRLLCAIALTKVRERARHHLRQRRAMQREIHGDAADDALARVSSSAPGPEDDAAFREQFQTALDTLDDEERSILELRLAARTQAEIAEALHISERTVRRILGRVEERLTQLLAT